MLLQPRGEQPDDSPPQWPEEDLQKTRTRLQKVEQDLDQGLKRVGSLDADLRKLAEALSASGVTLAALPGLREDLRQVRDQLSRVQDRQAALANRVEEALRQSQTGAGRERQEIAALSKQLEGLARGIDQQDSRIQIQEEAFRHLEEEVAGTRLAQQGLARDVEEVSSRGARNLEATIRLEQELSRAAERMEALRKEDEALRERLNLMQEQLHRDGERLDKLEEVAAFPQEARESLQRASFEREQLAERLGAVERASGELTERVQEFLQGLALVDQRGQAQATQLLFLTEELRGLGEEIRAQVKRLFQVTLRLRRRQAEALAQEIKDLSQGETVGEE